MAEITVLMTIFNHEKYLQQAIESILNQTYKDFHLILVDDCSSDDSVIIAEEYARLDSRIAIYKKAVNTGRACLVNEFIESIDTNYIALMDSDDYWKPTKLKKQIEIFIDKPQVGVIHTEGIVVDNRNHVSNAKFSWPDKVQNKLFSEIHYLPSKKEGNVYKDLLGGSFVFYSSAMIRKSCLDSVKMNESLRRSEDWVFFIDLAKHCEFAFIREPLTVYRVHGKNEQDRLGANLAIEIAKSRQYVIEKYGPDMDKRIKASHFKYIGNYFWHAGKSEEGINYLKKALRIYPLELRTWAYLFRAILFRTGQNQ